MKTIRTFAISACLLTAATASALAGPTAFTRRQMTDREYARLVSLTGVFDAAKNYNVLFDGHGTGLTPPTDEQWELLRTRDAIVTGVATERLSAPVSHDNSDTVWFPPIGTQGSEGSCTTWAVGYYIKTFQEAREHGWDLSGCVWEGGST